MLWKRISRLHSFMRYVFYFYFFKERNEMKWTSLHIDTKIRKLGFSSSVLVQKYNNLISYYPPTILVRLLKDWIWNKFIQRYKIMVKLLQFVEVEMGWRQIPVFISVQPAIFLRQTLPVELVMNSDHTEFLVSAWQWGIN